MRGISIILGKVFPLENRTESVLGQLQLSIRLRGEGLSRGVRRKLSCCALAAVVLFLFSSNSKAELALEIIVSGTIDDIVNENNLFDSSVQVGINYTYKFYFPMDPQRFGNDTPQFTSNYEASVQPAYSIVQYGDYTFLDSNPNNLFLSIWNDTTFSGRGETDGFQLQSDSDVASSTNPSAKTLYSDQNSLDAFDSSHSTFSSTAIPSASVFTTANFQNQNSSNALDFISFVHLNDNTNDPSFDNPAYVGGSYGSISAQISGCH